MSIRTEKILTLIKNQTNYTDEEALEKLIYWKNDYLSVIKEYLNPDFNKKKKEKEKSTNQKIMGEIRNFMDNSSKSYISLKNNIETDEDKLRKQIAINLSNLKLSSKKKD
jgi:hypothetical protein